MSKVALRSVIEEDLHFLVKWWNDGEVTSSMGFPKGMGVTTEDLYKRFYKQFESNDIESRIYLILADGIPVGDLQYGQLNLEEGSCRLGIKIGESEARGKGIAKKALQMIMNDLQDTFHLKMIHIDVFPENKPAYHLYKKLGFEDVEILKDVWTDETGISHDLVMMTKSL